MVCSEKDCACPRFQPQKRMETRCNICFHSITAHKGQQSATNHSVESVEICDCGQPFPLEAELGNFCTKCGVRKGIRRKISRVPTPTDLCPPIPSSPAPALAQSRVSSVVAASEPKRSSLTPKQAAEDLTSTQANGKACAQCGHINPEGPEDWVFCTECGARKKPSQVPEPIKVEAKSITPSLTALSSPNSPTTSACPAPSSSSSSASASSSAMFGKKPDNNPPPSKSVGALKINPGSSGVFALTPSVASQAAATPTAKGRTERKLFCPSCGAPFEASQEQFCSMCGVKLNSKFAQEARKQGPLSVATEEDREKEGKKGEADLENGRASVATPNSPKSEESASASQKKSLVGSAAAADAKKSTWIQYDPTKVIFSDYEFKGEQHQILDLFRKGQFGAHTVCVSALSECSTGQLCKLIPVIACAIADTPIWAEGRYDGLVKVLADRSKSTPVIQQALHALKISRLLEHPWAYTDWLENIPTESRLFNAASTCASQEVGFSLEFPADQRLSHPFEDNFVISHFNVAKIFNSNARPRLIEPLGRTDKSDVVQPGRPFILKSGDDLRQDVACIHIMSMMNNLWAVEGLQHDGLAVKSPCYGCLALTDTLGCIEFVPNAVPLKMVRDAGKYSAKAISRMITTGAGAFVAAYVLGVRDRHHDNILISKTDGSLFHIDFGYILGDQTTIDAGAFGITPDLKDVISSYGAVNWDLFVQLCVTAYKIIRDKARLVISFAVMMMAPFQSQDSVRRIIAERLRLTLEEEAALAKIRKKVRLAPSKFKTKLKNVVHGIATGK